MTVPDLYYFYRPQRRNIFRSVCQEFCPQGEACVAGGHAWQGGMCSRGACVAGGHVWQGGMCGRGACVAEGCAWQGGMHGRYYEIRSMSGLFASYWNVFLLFEKFVHLVCSELKVISHLSVAHIKPDTPMKFIHGSA